VDAIGNFYFSDGGNSVVRKVNTNGIITTVAGKNSLGGGYSGDGGAATNAALNNPNGVFVDGRALVHGRRLQQRHPEVNAGGIISTVAGNNARARATSGTAARRPRPRSTIPPGGGERGGKSVHRGQRQQLVREVTDVNFTGAIANGTLTSPMFKPTARAIIR